MFGNISGNLKTDSLCNKVLTLYSPFTEGPILFYYILISSKRPPKRRGLSGRSWEVVVYKNRTTGELFHPRLKGIQNRHLPPLLRFIPQFAQICLIFALSKFEANPFFRPV